VLECCGYPLKRTNAGCLVNSTRVFCMPVAITCMVRKCPGSDLDKGLFNYNFRDSSVDTPAVSIYNFTTAFTFCVITFPSTEVQNTPYQGCAKFMETGTKIKKCGAYK